NAPGNVMQIPVLCALWAENQGFHTQPQRLRRYHSAQSRPTINRKNGGLSQGVNLVSVATSRSRGCSLMCLRSAGSCYGAIASPPLSAVSLAKLAINSGRAAAFSNSKSCSNTTNRALLSPSDAPSLVACTTIE